MTKPAINVKSNNLLIVQNIKMYAPITAIYPSPYGTLEAISIWTISLNLFDIFIEYKNIIADPKSLKLSYSKSIVNSTPTYFKNYFGVSEFMNPPNIKFPICAKRT